ncbi:MAG TPA: hypothetical protein VH520_00820 [Streptosporangiaceae bacterium]|jgi:hypothetical protein
MLAIQDALCESTGSPEMLVFQTLSAGNIGQPGAPGTVVPVGALRADEGAADGDEAGCAEGWAEMPASAAPYPGFGAAAFRTPAEQPALAAVIAISAAATAARTARLVKRDVGGITVASCH